MSAENQDQDFAELQRLLKLKRHEQPPPRYFKDFSGQVTTRIRAGDVGKLETFEDVVTQTPWVQRIWQSFVGQPAFSGIAAAAVCGLIMAGIFVADNRPKELPTFMGNQAAVPKQSPQPALLANDGQGAVLFANGTNPSPVLPATPSLFSNPGYTPGQALPASGRPLAPQ